MKSFILQTNGSGCWSKEKRKVKITRIKIGPYGGREVCVYFSKKSWNTEKHGLIYTDRQFINEFRKYMISKGVPKYIANDFDYTEQGMQCDNYVSLEYGDRTEKYLFNKLFGE